MKISGMRNGWQYVRKFNYKIRRKWVVGKVNETEFGKSETRMRFDIGITIEKKRTNPNENRGF